MNEKYSERVLKIVEQIRDPKIKVVSFDVFDTLLLRPVSTPADIFRLLENKLEIYNFHNMRVVAEAEARKHYNMDRQDITLDEIYDTYSFLFSVPENEIDTLKQEELKIEYTLLYARKTTKYLYEQAVVAGKQIIIISDMYLASDFIDKCLKKNGYDKHSHVYVSSETGYLKSTKMMYQYVLSELALQGVEPDEIIHIGDNKKADVECAAAVGINSIHIPKATDVRNRCKQLKRLYEFVLSDVMNSNNAILYGFLANLYFDDPFIEYDKNSFFNGEAKLMGYWFAPLMIGFTKWMIECIETRKIEQLLFVWRDGYLPSQLFNVMRSVFTDRNINVCNIYMGRALRMPYMAYDKNGFFNSFSDYPLRPECTVDHFIRNRVLCDDKEQYKDVLKIFLNHGYLNKDAIIGPYERYRGFLYELEPFFVKNAKEKIKCSDKYIMDNVEKDKRIAVFDRSPRGKSSRFLKQYFNVDSVCLTTEVYDTPKSKLKDINMVVERYLEYGNYYINKMGRVWAMLFERVISDTAPGFKDIIQNNNGSYTVKLDEPEKSEENKEADNIIKKVQQSIIEFTELFTEIMGEYLPYLVLDRHGLFDYTIELLAVPGKKDADLIVAINPDKSLLAPIDESVFINWYNKKYKNSRTNEQLKRKTMWDYIRHTGYVTAEKIGILPQARGIYRKIIGNPLEPIISYEKIHEQIDKQIDYLNNLDCSKINAIFLGSVPQEASKFINTLAHEEKKVHFLFVAAGFIKIPTWLDFPCIEGPQIFSFWGIEGKNIKIKIPSYIKKEVYGKEYLQDLVKRRMLRGYSESVSIALAYETERYYKVLIEKINPILLIVWNNWGNNSVVPSEICKQREIPVISMERGFLEGTIMLSAKGYGKDEINLAPEKFCKIPVEQEEIQKAQKIIDFLHGTGFNRYAQPQNNNLCKLKERLNDKKPTILLVGAFDCENPAFPRNETYSPTFELSSDALKYISKLAKSNKWNLIYKPHPLMDKIGSIDKSSKISSNIFYVRDVNINELIDMSDVVVSMISGVTYIALTRGKPIVELAHTPLKGKGCCYEVNLIEEIESIITKSIKDGLTEDQKRMFIYHIAQVCKNYYFDDLSVRTIRYGRSINEAVNLIEEYIGENEYESSCMDTN